jgi:hypothetical protein
MASLAASGKRIGYSLFLVAVIAFFVGLAADFPGAMVAIVVVGLIAGSILLAPAIVVAYGVKKAEREDPLRP